MRKVFAAAVPLLVSLTAVPAAAGLSAAATLPAATGPSPTISAVAGGPGITAPALTVGQQPDSVVPIGRSLFVADSAYSELRRVDLDTGIESPYAGAGANGFGGTQSAVENVHLYGSVGLASDSVGDLFDADNLNVYEFTPSGEMKRVVSGTLAWPSPTAATLDGMPADGAPMLGMTAIAVSPDGHLFIAMKSSQPSMFTGGILELGDDGKLHFLFGSGATQFPDGGTMPAADAEVDVPNAISFDAQGRLLVADSGPSGQHAGRVYRWDPATNTVTVIAGSRGCNISAPDGSATTTWCVGGFTGMAVLTDGRTILASGCGLLAIAADGTASAVSSNPCSTDTDASARVASFDRSVRLAADPLGGFYVADREGYRVSHIDAAGNVTSVAGHATLTDPDDGQAATTATLAAPSGVTRDPSGRLVIADQLAHRIRRVEPDGTVDTIAGTGAAQCADSSCGDGGPAASAVLRKPGLIRADGSGNLYVADGPSIRQIDTAGTITTVAGQGTISCSNQTPPTTGRDICLLDDPAFALDAGGLLYVTDLHQVFRVDPATGATTVVAGKWWDTTAYGAPPPSGPGHLATDWVFQAIQALAVDEHGDLFIADNVLRVIYQVTPDGNLRRFAGSGEPSWECADPDCGNGGKATSAGLDRTQDLAVDGAGDVDLIEGPDVRRIWPNGLISVIAGQYSGGYDRYPMRDGVDPLQESIEVYAAYSAGDSDSIDLADSPYPTTHHRIWRLTGLDNLAEPQGARAVITSGPADGSTSNADVSFAFTSDEQYATFACSLDGASATSCTSPISYHLAPGSHSFAVTATYSGATAGPTTVHWTVADTVSPEVSLRALPTVTLAPSAALSWSATDVGSGVASYDVRSERATYARGFSAWAIPRGWQGLTVPRTSLNLAPGDNACVEVRARDRAGNTSAWSAPTCTSRSLDDRALAASGGWRRLAGTADYLRTDTNGSTVNTTLSLAHVTLDRLGVLVTLEPGGGSIAVSVGGHRLATYALAASTVTRQRLLMLSRFSLRSGTVVITVTTRGHPVDIDGLVTSRT